MKTSWKDDFEIAPGALWFNGGYFCPIPRVERAAIEEAYGYKASPTTMPDGIVFGYPDSIRERLARVMGLPAEEFGVTTSMAGGATIIAQGLRWEPGDRVLFGPDEYPGNVYPWFALEAQGVSCEFIGTSGRALTPEDLDRALASGGRVRVLAIAATHYMTGDIHPLAALSERLHRHGALLIADATQSVGAVNLPWPSLGADAILFSGYKWLFGPYGTGALWVRGALRDALVPVGGNFWALRAARDFEKVLRETPREYESHGRVLDVGQAASFLNIAGFRAGLDFLLSVGVAAVEAHHRALQDRIVTALVETPLRPVTRLDAEHRSPMLMLEADRGVDLARMCADLARRQIHVSLRNGRVRVSPGIWAEPAEAEVFADAVKHSLREPRPV
jgi:selenocysteine lyase/cysteine desulfurase